MEGFRSGRITKGVGGIYTVRDDDTGEYVSCAVRGGVRRRSRNLIVGDMVEFGSTGDPDIPYILERVLPRKNQLIRPALANLSDMILVFSVADPVPDLKLLDKMLIICRINDIMPVIIFTKTDLDPEAGTRLYDIYSACGYKCFMSSRDNKPDRDEIIRITGKGITGLAGPSGVGKSTLCNYLLDDKELKVGEVSDRLKRGKHTTRHVELFELGEGFMSDTPGFTSLDLYEIGVEYGEVVLGYPEIEKLSGGCRFDDCRHINETDCAVLGALGTEVDQGRYDRYKEFYDELYIRRNDYTGRKRL